MKRNYPQQKCKAQLKENIFRSDTSNPCQPFVQKFVKYFCYSKHPDCKISFINLGHARLSKGY